MIDKQEFYYGSALIRALNSQKCSNIKRFGIGYLINDKSAVLIKYSTKVKSPWRFIISSEEVNFLLESEKLWVKGVIALVCGGDGVCAIDWAEASTLLDGAVMWLSAKRNFNEQYAVAGPNGKLSHKVPLQDWPEIVIN
ncbi:MAG: hypothetical protein WC545_01445 [Patescibacteria group bacterium]